MPDAATITTILGGIASRKRLLDAGCSGGDVTRDVRLGRIYRIRQGHYAIPSAPFEGVVAVRAGGVLAGPSAARSHGLWAGLDERIHVAVPRNASRLRLDRSPYVRADRYEPEVVLHWCEGIDRHDWRVGFDTCLRQMVDWTDRETAVACLDTAVAARSVLEVRSAFASSELRGRLIAAAARRGSGSGLESIVRQRLEAQGFTVAQQVHVPGVGSVDMIIDNVLVLEVDGRQFHWNAAAFEEDRRRDGVLALVGHQRLRLTYRQVVEDWPASLSLIQELVRRMRR